MVDYCWPHAIQAAEVSNSWFLQGDISNVTLLLPDDVLSLSWLLPGNIKSFTDHQKSWKLMSQNRMKKSQCLWHHLFSILNYKLALAILYQVPIITTKPRTNRTYVPQQDRFTEALKKEMSNKNKVGIPTGFFHFKKLIIQLRKRAKVKCCKKFVFQNAKLQCHKIVRLTRNFESYEWSIEVFPFSWTFITVENVDLDQ